MARPLRLEYAGALYHVTSRGDRREDIYRDDEDREEWPWSSYPATIGITKAPEWLDTDWLLNQRIGRIKALFC